MKLVDWIHVKARNNAGSKMQWNFSSMNYVSYQVGYVDLLLEAGYSSDKDSNLTFFKSLHWNITRV